MTVRLSRDDVLKAEDRPSEEVEVREWGGTVLVRGLDGKGRDEFFASLTTTRKGQQVLDNYNATAKLVARCIVDDDGQPVFTQNDVDALGGKSGAALDRVYSVAQRLS